MVKEIRFAGRVVLLTAIATVLAAYALNLAWYKYSYRETEVSPTGDHWSDDGVIDPDGARTRIGN